MIAAPRGSSRASTTGLPSFGWDSFEDLVAAMSSVAGKVAGAELLEDESRFVDLPNVSALVR